MQVRVVFTYTHSSQGSNQELRKQYVKSGTVLQYQHYTAIYSDNNTNEYLVKC